MTDKSKITASKVVYMKTKKMRPETNIKCVCVCMCVSSFIIGLQLYLKKILCMDIELEPS